MNNIDLKKIIIILLIPLLIIGYFIFYFFFDKGGSNSLDKLSTFFPFESEEGFALGGDNNLSVSGEPIVNESTSLTIPLLRQITTTPVAGAVIFTEKSTNNEDSTNYLIRYIEKATGHIYETSTASLTQTRISNTTIPQIQETLWLKNDSLAIRYLDDGNTIKTFLANLTPDETSGQKLEGTFLQDNIIELIEFNKGIFYLIENGQGSIGITVDNKNENKKIIFESPLQEWLIKNVDDRYISFTTKPAITVTGFSFLLDTKTGNFDKIIEEKNNLSVLISNLFNILYSEYGKLGPQLFVYNKEKKTNTEISLQTFPEKCVWNTDNTAIFCGVPEEKLSNSDLTNWYKGKISFSDNLWKIDTLTGNSEFLLSPVEFETGKIDIINPILNEDNNYLLFTNKKDFGLWVLQLKKNL